MNTTNKKFAFYTLGCRANQYQTEVLKSQFVDNISELTTFDSIADIYVINTCTVTRDAERKSRQAIRRALRQNPKAKVIISGCYAKLNDKELKKSFPEITLTPSPTASGFPPLPSMEKGIKGGRVRENLMIQDGCEHFCSYCIVPYARGKIKSKPLEKIIGEAKQLVKSGAKEIVLTGINLGTYQHNLSSVLKHLSLINNIYRIRLSSIEPMYITKELIDAVVENPKACKHLHIPLQSGDNNLLKAMNRNYSQYDYLKLVEYIRNKMPDCGITTDVIVGFPGETEKEFQNTIDLINKIKFSRIHVFSYSKRKGTPAAKLPEQIDPKIKKHRNKILRELRVKYMSEFARQYLNKKVEILVEQKGEGLTSNYIRIICPAKEKQIGTLRKVALKEVKKEYCYAN